MRLFGYRGVEFHAFLYDVIFRVSLEDEFCHYLRVIWEVVSAECEFRCETCEGFLCAFEHVSFEAFYVGFYEVDAWEVIFADKVIYCGSFK